MEVRPALKHRAPCECCDEHGGPDHQFVAYHDEEPWCADCGMSPSSLLPANEPGGCPAHPHATHEHGFGLAGGGYGPYSICNECGSVFDKIDLPDDEA